MKIRHVLIFLNWLSTCFVRGEDDDAISVAVSVHGQTVTLHIATDKGIPDQADLENTKHFFSIVSDIFHHQDELAAKNESFTFEHDIDRIEHAIVDAIWMCFLRKAGLLRFTAVVNERELHLLLTSWAKWRSETNQGNESSKRISNLAKVLSDGDNNAMLRVTFDFISDPEHATLASESHDLRFRYFSRMTTLCSALINSDFLYDAINGRWAYARTSILIQLLYRRLWRVYSYHHGAVRFAKVGLAHFRSVCGSQSTLEYVWVEYKLGILHWQSITYTDEEINEWLETFSIPRPVFKIDPSWVKGEAGTVRPHSQIQMMHYLDAKRIFKCWKTLSGPVNGCVILAIATNPSVQSRQDRNGYSRARRRRRYIRTG
ncbi:uncharacterized protein EV420DRAFT_1518291 [Desarmillaria tabescens]|uniref:Uncharacterized protein n=1 Tax=Armillaria tabescens TaxID=1929756 RepID=A0AA39NDG4_ARMTA|nr:uncharacterized protein EV420DRAFT_1518291 [Desarmillaria tabescens]KAK0463448.1 hypothetical protein EV420DRAFT_1518291 [Desarmillaria tabescens]